MCGCMYKLFAQMKISCNDSNVKFTIHMLLAINLLLLNLYKESKEDQLLTYDNEF